MRYFIIGEKTLLRDLLEATLIERGLDVVAQQGLDAELRGAEGGDIVILLDARKVSRTLSAIRSIRNSGTELKIIVIAERSAYTEISRNCTPLVNAVMSDTAPLEVIQSAITLVEHSLSVGAVPGSECSGEASRFQELPRHRSEPEATESVEVDRKIGLSEREKRILQLLATGAANKEIAKSLGIAEATVKAHLRATFLKIGCNNRTQAAIWTTQHLR